MNYQKLEISGIRLIGFFFLFTTTHHLSGVILAAYYEVHDPNYESLFAAMANSRIVTQSVLAVLVFVLSLVAMFRPNTIQKRWRKIKKEENEEGFETEYLTLFRIAALVMSLLFAQQSLSDLIHIVMMSFTSYSGFNAPQTISNLLLLSASVYLFIKPEVINKWK